MSPEGKWEKVVATNKKLAGLKEVSLVCVNGSLFLRHKNLIDRPFIVLNCETLKGAA
jgi:hypothetical protein